MIGMVFLMFTLMLLDTRAKLIGEKNFNEVVTYFKAIPDLKG